MKTYHYTHEVTKAVERVIDTLDTGTYGLLLQRDEDTIQDLKDDLFVTDDVTGNGSGSYTFNTRTAEENLIGNWDLLRDAHRDLCPDVDLIEKGPEWCDVLIRVYVLDWCIENALNKIVKEEK
ncbi:hypothetical protein O0Z71_04555 [Ligilactobacillus saerimneri]|uniref:hypothetical protein n=1 Tax=Ligilactobacillus saerimneri TaxID=228229 RepID=UPI0022A6D9AB|nr:hypothetical protein [Ligilactobacillus saerimneri]MCZ0891713.1 hypothetical protein [Ligilactobacillus saerimneri]